MKVPPSTKPPEKQPTYEKDRTATRRSVAGAAGGMKGVDYEDDRRPQLGEDGHPRSTGAAGGAGGEGRGAPAQVGRDAVDRGPVQPDAARILAENEGAQPMPLHTRRRRRFVARDRLTIDKDAPETRRQRTAEEEEEDEATDERSIEQTLEFFPDAVGDDGPSVSRAQLFSPDTKPEPGDLSLTDPDTIQRALETPLAYAKHAMILAEAFRRSTGATRAEAIDYLGRLFVSPRDRTFGRSALKEFGPASGILDVYPLEVVEHVLSRYPDFLPKVSLGRFFHREGTRAEVWRTDTRTPVILEYPEDLKIRGFALRGGGRPGYVFEPHDVLGRYRLLVQTPGRWTCLVSGVSRTGHTTVETAVVEVTLAAGDVVPPALPEPYPERDAARVEQWPVPTPGAPVPQEISGVHAAPAGLSTGELLHQRALDDERRLRDVDLEVSEEDAPISDRRIVDAAPVAIPAGETTRERPPLRVPGASTQGRAPARGTAKAEGEEARALGARASLPPAATDPSLRVITEASARVPPKAATDPQVRAITGAARAPARSAASASPGTGAASTPSDATESGARSSPPAPTATTSGVMRMPAEPDAARGAPTATTSGVMRAPAEPDAARGAPTATTSGAMRAPAEPDAARGAPTATTSGVMRAPAEATSPPSEQPRHAPLASRIPAAAITEPGARVPGTGAPRAPAPSGGASPPSSRGAAASGSVTPPAGASATAPAGASTPVPSARATASSGAAPSPSAGAHRIAGASAPPARADRASATRAEAPRGGPAAPSPSAAPSAATPPAAPPPSARAPRPRPKPRAERPPTPRASAPTTVDRTELSGAIADAFARLAATPIAPAVPALALPIAVAPAVAASSPPIPPTAAAATPSRPRSPQPSPPADAPRPVLEVRPQSPLFDDTDTPASTDDIELRAAQDASEQLEEVDPADVQAIDSPTSRITIRPELAADLLLDTPPAPSEPLPTARPRLAPRALKRSDSQVDPSTGEPSD